MWGEPDGVAPQVRKEVRSGRDGTGYDIAGDTRASAAAGRIVRPAGGM